MEFWQGVLSGATGGIVTGAFALGVTVLTLRHQADEAEARRRETRAEGLRIAFGDVVGAADRMFIPLAQYRLAFQNGARAEASEHQTFFDAYLRFRDSRVPLLLEAESGVRALVVKTNSVMDGLQEIAKYGERLFNEEDQTAAIAMVDRVEADCQEVIRLARDHLASIRPKSVNAKPQSSGG